MANTERCKTCIFWKKETVDFGDCINQYILSRDDLASGNKLKDNDSVFSHSGKYQSMGRNFGCVHHHPLKK